MAFESDYRESNPGLHRLYVSFAMHSLVVIDRAQRALDRCGNTSLAEMQFAIHQERDKLVKTDAAYAEADELLYIVKHGKPRDMVVSDKDVIAHTDEPAA